MINARVFVLIVKSTARYVITNCDSLQETGERGEPEERRGDNYYR